MMSFIIYLFEVSICLIAFYGLFNLLFKRLTFFNLNRLYLILMISISFLLPMFDFGLVKSIPILSVTVETVEIGMRSLEQSALTLPTASDFLIITYVLVATMFFLRLIFRLFSIFKVTRLGSRERMDGCNLIRHKKQEFASFFNFIFVPKDFNKETIESQTILQHELVHVQQFHSMDLLFVELSSVLLWFNPVLILWKRAMKLNHEFIADHVCVKNQEERKNYIELILSQSMPGIDFDLANSFYHSPLKERIVMLNQSKSKQSFRWIYLSILPMLFGMFFLFSCSTESEPANGLEKVEQLTEPSDVFKVVEEMPEFPGGQDEMMKYIYTNITYPQEARKDGIEGLVVVQYVVGKDGKINDAKVVREIGGGCDEEALRVVNSMPKWNPGKQRGKIVDVQYNLPVRFKLQ